MKIFFISSVIIFFDIGSLSRFAVARFNVLWSFSLYDPCPSSHQITNYVNKTDQQSQSGHII